jgi:hypothetical protein
MTLDQLNSLDENELAMALYIVNHISPPSALKVELTPRNLTWFKHHMLIQKIVDVFPQVLPESHGTFSSLLQKMGVTITIKKMEPVIPASEVTASLPPTSSAV